MHKVLDNLYILHFTQCQVLSGEDNDLCLQAALAGWVSHILVHIINEKTRC